MRIRIIFSVLFLASCCSVSFSQSSHFIDSLLHAAIPQYSAVIDNPAKYKLQIIFTQIDRDKNNKPTFTDHKYKLSKRYFYPASTVKLPMSILALMKVRDLHSKKIDRTTGFGTDSSFYCQERIKVDSTSGGTFPSVENYIKKMMLVSDNTAFTRTYEFVGYEYAHKKLKEMGFGQVRLLNRLSVSCQGDTAKITPPVYFLNEKRDTLYKQPAGTFTTHLYHPIKSSLAGTAYTDGGKRIHTPKDFSRHNYFYVSDLHGMMKQLVFNNQLPEKERMDLDDDDRIFLLEQMGLYPKECEYPLYEKKVFYDSYKKYFLHGCAVATIRQDTLRVINVVGKAYGFLIDCAYIIDLKNKTEFLLTTTIYVNERNVIGSGKYEYDQLGLPFMRDLSWALYNYDRNRERKNMPDLSEFEKMFNYKKE
jgi:hypothetical protein